jgi:hypothetical protein
MQLRWRLAVIVILFALGVVATSTHQYAAAKPAPAPSASPTNPPTPYMPVDQVTNGTWDVIMQSKDISYSTIKLKNAGTTVTGVWIADKKTVYQLSGTRDGSHLLLDIKSSDKPDVVLGKIDATIDGIADMVGTITLGTVETPFQGAQHTRVPPPVEASPTPGSPGGQPGGYPGSGGGGGYPGGGS